MLRLRVARVRTDVHATPRHRRPRARSGQRLRRHHDARAICRSVNSKPREHHQGPHAACRNSASRRAAPVATNIRNITASPDRRLSRPDELLDVRPYAKGLHHYILNHPRPSTGLPRKFNVAFDKRRQPLRRRRYETTSASSRCASPEKAVGSELARDFRGPRASRASSLLTTDPETWRLLSASNSAASPATRTSPATPAFSSRPAQFRSPSPRQ